MKETSMRRCKVEQSTRSWFHDAKLDLWIYFCHTVRHKYVVPYNLDKVIILRNINFHILLLSFYFSTRQINLMTLCTLNQHITSVSSEKAVASMITKISHFTSNPVFADQQNCNFINFIQTCRNPTIHGAVLGADTRGRRSVQNKP